LNAYQKPGAEPEREDRVVAVVEIVDAIEEGHLDVRLERLSRIGGDSRPPRARRHHQKVERKGEPAVVQGVHRD
jgi:hypothetical protein